MSEPTEKKQDTKFKAGQSGNPAGRPKGSRNKLGENFLSDVQSLWEEEGPKILQDARQEKPMEFAKMVAGILPKELLVRKAPEEEMTDDELATAIEQFRSLAVELRAGRAGDSATHEGSVTPQ